MKKKFYKSFIITILALILFPLSGFSQCNRQTDSLALIALYNSTNGSNWTNTWNLNQSMDTWYGVTLTNSGCVNTLILNNNNLAGNLINLNLKYAREIRMSNNQLSGSIPDFTNLYHIEVLVLGGNPLTGSIPNFSNLWTAKVLSFYGCQLTGSIPNFYLPNLEGLSFGHNQLSGTIPNFNLPNVINLYLAHNQLSGNIPNLSGCPNLKRIYWHYNQMSGVLNDFTHPTLTDFWINDNNFSGIVPDYNIPNLLAIYLANNSFDSIPNFDQLINLGYLSLGGNKITFDDIVGNVNIAYNFFSYAPQDTIGTDTTIIITENSNYTINLQFDDSITSSTYYWYRNGVIIDSTTTNEYTITNAQISDIGTYTCEINNSVATDLTLYTAPIHLVFNYMLSCRYLDSLALVELYDSLGGINWTYTATTFFEPSTFNNYAPIPNPGNAWNFSTPIDTWHGIVLNNNGCVQKIILHGNQLNGFIPNPSFSELEDFDMGSNQLLGTLPDFTNLPNIKSINLFANDIIGTLPNFSHIPTLEYLWLPNNDLTGTIPDFSNLPALKRLVLASNEMSGAVPNFSNLPILEGLHIWNNNFTGAIPDFSNFFNLKELWLAINPLNTSLPDFSNLPNLELLVVSEAALVGNIPDFSDNCPLLKRLSISHNKFSNENFLPSYNSNKSLITNNLGSFSYAPQDTIGIDTTIILSKNNDYVIHLNIDDTVTTSKYFWYKDGLFLDSTTINQYMITNVQFSDAGQYNIRITSSVVKNLTLHTAPITLNICPDIDIILDTMICIGEQVTLNAQNIGATYIWNTLDTSSMITVNTSNSYIVSITGRGCIMVDTISVIVSQPIFSVNQTDTSLCAEDNGNEVTISTANDSPYTYQWNTGSTDTIISNLSIGTYFVAVMDSNNCTLTDTIQVIEPSGISSNILSDSVSCYQGNDGAVSVIAIGGTPNYTYSWSNGSNSISSNSFSTGTYIITVTDANNCFHLDTVNIGEPNLIISSFDTIICNGNLFEGYNITGIFIDTFSTSDGCDSVRTLNLIVNPTQTTSLNQVICQGQSFTIGTSIYTASGTYTNTLQTWQGCDSTVTLNLIANVTDSTVINDTICAGTVYDFDGTTINASGIYQNVYVNTEGCDSIVILDLLITTPLIITDSTVINMIGNALGSIDITASGGIQPYSYLWSNGAITEDITNLLIDFYAVTITDAIGCQVDYSFGIVNTKNELSFNVFNIYPNPTTGQFSVNAAFATPLDDVRLEVRSINGQLVRNIELGNNVIKIQENLNLDDLPSGSYIIMLRSIDELVTEQIVLTK
jgi:Leucine-rich repeat (LRR) protein